MIMCITAVYGYSWIEKLNVIAVPALIPILVYAMIVVFGDPESIVKITNHTPTTQMSMIAAVGTSIGGFASGAVLSGDVTRYCKSRKDVVISSIVGVIPVGVGTMPVSYTHLDVYKRQPLRCSCWVPSLRAILWPSRSCLRSGRMQIW